MRILPFAIAGVQMLAVAAVVAAPLSDHRGPKQDGVFPAKDYITDFSLGEKLILWKTLLPAEGQNTPIVVGDKVFLLCSNGLESDCPELFCLSIHDGKVLWRKPVDNLDALSAEQQAAAKALRAKELMFNRKAREFFFRFKELQAVGYSNSVESGIHKDMRVYRRDFAAGTFEVPATTKANACMALVLKPME